jgi:hypothetical protein
MKNGNKIVCFRVHLPLDTISALGDYAALQEKQWGRSSTGKSISPLSRRCPFESGRPHHQCIRIIILI